MFENSLLPPTATKTERLLEEVRKISAEVRESIPNVGSVKRDILPETIPFLIYEYSLEEVMPYLKDPTRALSEGRQWQRIRGTPDAIAMALAWVDYTAEIEADSADSWWDLFQVGLDSVPADFWGDLERIIGLTRLSKASHEDVIRVYSGYDHRALKFNDGQFNGPFLFNDWSGRWVKDNWPKLSFGHELIERSTYPMQAVTSRSIVPSALTYHSKVPKGFLFNHDLMNGPVLYNKGTYSTSVQELETVTVSEVHREGGWPLGEWPDLSYGEPKPDSVSVLRTEYMDNGFMFNVHKVNGVEAFNEPHEINDGIDHGKIATSTETFEPALLNGGMIMNTHKFNGADITGNL